MVEPYVSLLWWAVGCLVLVVVCEVVAIGFGCRWSWCRWFGLVHVPVWVLMVTLFGVACSAGQLDPMAFNYTSGVVGIVGFMLMLLVLLACIADEPDGRFLGGAFRLVSMVLVVVLPVGLVVNSLMSSGEGFRSTSVEYSVSGDGSRSPVVSERYDLARVGSSGWVSVAAVEHKHPGRDSGSVLRTAYTWNEVRGNEAVAKTATVEPDEVSVVEDVAGNGTPWVEYVPVYHLAPAGIFDGSHPDPVQGTLCVKGRDKGCKVNAWRAHVKYVLHVPASA